MLVAIGQFSMVQLLNDFKLMALSRTDHKHELNKANCNFIHSDGWGIVLGKSGKIEELYKKDVACWKDPRFQEYYNVNADFVILHARRASSGAPIDCSYTHPFEKEGWYFCHNGTITDPPAEDKRDSEQFFTLLLTNIKQHDNVKEAIKDSIDQMKDYTALNFILANSNKAYILVKHRQSPDYYTMKYSQKENYVIVSSETLPNFSGEWARIANGTVLELDIQNNELKISSLINQESI
jgi:predicted glutamine amidotransferase